MTWLILFQVRHHKDVFKEFLSDLQQNVSQRKKRSVQPSMITDPELKEIIQELTTVQVLHRFCDSAKLHIHVYTANTLELFHRVCSMKRRLSIYFTRLHVSKTRA